MSSEIDNTEPTKDAWSDWLLNHRHAGDTAYQRVVRGMVERIRDRVLDGARLAAGMTLADIGTGDGLIAFGAIARFGQTLRVILTDISLPLLEHARHVAQELNVISQCTFLQGNAERLVGIEDSSVDVLTTRAVLAYVADKPAAFREFHRVLRPGGRISIAEPIFRDQALEALALAKAFDASQSQQAMSFPHLLQRWKAAQFPSTEQQISQSPIANYTERDLFRLAREAGFIDLHLELHIDQRLSSITSWDVFLNTAPHPLAAPLKQILRAQFSEPERRLFERVMRPQIESGKAMETDAIAYLTASKPPVKK